MSASAPASFLNTQVIVGLSGGVDSAVSALLLKQHGYEVRGLFMKNWEDDDTEEYCSSRQDLIDAVTVADRIGIDIDAVNFSTEYKERVFSDFLAEYKAGRTPNPDVLCNAEIKFKAFLNHALTAGAAWMATGHYAHIQAQEGRFFLLKGSDPNKDQSYFLYRLGQAQLARSLFPVGGFTKIEVRRMAQRAGLAVYDKKDSTGICFIGERPFRAFLSRYLPVQPGAIRTLAGKTIGEHPGIIYYTLGQREGLGIGGVRDAAEAPWYVVAKDVVDNVLVVAQGHDHPLLFSHTLATTQLSWVSGDPPATPFRCMAKTRYRQSDQTCTITAINRDRARVEFDQPQRAITSGQSVVFYKGEICLGGGIIDAIPKS